MIDPARPADEIAFRFLAPGRRPCKGDSGAWPEPGVWTPRIARGYHGCRPRQLLDWIGPELWRAEFRDALAAGDEIVAARARLIERVEAWDERSARLFACDCAERVVGLTGPDVRAVAAIAVARWFAVGVASEKERAAAEAAAAVATDAAGALAATWAAARAAAWTVASAADRAADMAARNAAWAAARAAAFQATGAAERSWQSARLLETLGLAEPAHA